MHTRGTVSVLLYPRVHFLFPCTLYVYACTSITRLTHAPLVHDFIAITTQRRRRFFTVLCTFYLFLRIVASVASLRLASAPRTFRFNTLSLFHFPFSCQRETTSGPPIVSRVGLCRQVSKLSHRNESVLLEILPLCRRDTCKRVSPY